MPPLHDPNLPPSGFVAAPSSSSGALDKVVPYLKAYAALLGSVCTALLGVYGPDTQLGHILTVAAALATAVATFAVPNLDPKAQHQAESVQPPDEGGYASLPILLLIALAVVVFVFALRG